MNSNIDTKMIKYSWKNILHMFWPDCNCDADLTTAQLHAIMQKQKKTQMKAHQKSLTVISVTGEITPVYGTPAEQILVA